MKIALGCDHRGTEAAQVVADHLRAGGREVDVQALCTGDSCDYPDAAYLVARQVADGQADRGVLICGSGVGMSIAANKVDGARAALVYEERAAEASRRHNDANVLCFSGEGTTLDAMRRIVDVWLATPFDGGRHERRVRKMTAIEQGLDPTNTDVNQPAG